MLTSLYALTRTVDLFAFYTVNTALLLVWFRTCFSRIISKQRSFSIARHSQAVFVLFGNNTDRLYTLFRFSSIRIAPFHCFIALNFCIAVSSLPRLFFYDNAHGHQGRKNISGCFPLPSSVLFPFSSFPLLFYPFIFATKRPPSLKSS